VREPTRAVYARLPDRLATKIDRAAARLGLSKTDVLAALVNDHLEVEGDQLVVRAGKHLGTDPSGHDGDGGAEVLTVEEAAELLRLPSGEVLAAVQAGQIPARRIGSHWRLTRSGLLRWLRDSPSGSTS
jgi:excisionase family DNA binding protein